MVALARSGTRVIYDLYDPVPHELMASVRERPRHHRDELQLKRHQLTVEIALLTGDAFVCASERQRDLWLGALGALGRLNYEEHARDPSFRHLIDVVPFGIEVARPKVGNPVLRGVLPGVDERSRVLVWAGGIWNWLDPLTVIRAVYELSQTRDDIRLVFMGLRRPNIGGVETTMAERAVTLARELGLHGSRVFFNDEWVPHEQRGGWLAEADIGVSAHFDTLETRFALRTRVLDYLWAGLPIVTTGGDVLGELVEKERLGASLPAEDVAAWVAAVQGLLDDERSGKEARGRVAGVGERFEWPRIVEPLVRLIAEPGRRVDLPQRARLAGVHDLYLAGRISLMRRGAAGTLTEGLKRRTSRPGRLT
jgi:glycosyltransferase involved in cell wall biosynthesis